MQLLKYKHSTSTLFSTQNSTMQTGKHKCCTKDTCFNKKQNLNSYCICWMSVNYNKSASFSLIATWSFIHSLSMCFWKKVLIRTKKFLIVKRDIVLLMSLMMLDYEVWMKRSIWFETLACVCENDSYESVYGSKNFERLYQKEFRKTKTG